METVGFEMGRPFLSRTYSRVSDTDGIERSAPTRADAVAKNGHGQDRGALLKRNYPWMLFTKGKT